MLSKHPPYNPVPYQGKLTVANLITDVTRLAGVGGDGAAYPDSSVGVWPAATNRNVNGNATTNTTGVTDNSSTTSRVTTGTVKFGATAFEVVSGNATANEGPSQAISGGAAATVYTVSAWAWLVSGAATVRVALYDSVSGKQGGTPVVLTTTPVRLTVTAMTGAASAGHASYVETTTQQAGTWRIGGWQVETGSIATPYIHTDGGTASRSAGSITAIPAGVLDETRMWVMARIRVDSTQAGSGRIFSFGDSSNERLEMVITSTTNRTSTLRQTGGAGATATAASGTIAVGDAATYIGGWDANFCYAANNGAALTSAANTSIPTLSATEAALGKQSFASFGYPGVSLKWLAIGRAAPTDALSSLGYT